MYQFSRSDSSEFTRFDFTKSEGDTVDRRKNIILQNKSNDGKKFQFLGSYDYAIDNLFYDGITVVEDSLGITSSSGIGDFWKLIGAKINGKEYGRLLSVTEDTPLQPTTFLLSQNYPNPFNPQTTISFTLQKSGFTTLIIYDILGREVMVLVNEVLDAGIYYKKVFNALRLSSGMYFARLISNEKSMAMKMLFMK